MKLDVAAVRDLNSIKTFKCLYLDQKTKGQQIIIKKNRSRHNNNLNYGTAEIKQ